MPISPANNLNIKTLTISQLANATNLGNNDLIQISQYDSGVYYSKKSTLSTLVNYFSTTTGTYSGSFQLQTSNFLSGITGSISTANSAGTFGDDNFLPIKINGTMYKIPLYPNS